MSRPIFDHVVLGDLPQSKLTIEAIDKPGAGGANHLYVIEGFDTTSNPSDLHVGRGPTLLLSTSLPPEDLLALSSWAEGQRPLDHTAILFQNGPIPDKGMNGVTQEALIAIVIDRLKGFQKGNFACRENAIALTKLQEALFWLKSRTEDRLRRGVDGTLTK